MFISGVNDILNFFLWEKTVSFVLYQSCLWNKSKLILTMKLDFVKSVFPSYAFIRYSISVEAHQNYFQFLRDIYGYTNIDRNTSVLYWIHFVSICVVYHQKLQCCDLFMTMFQFILKLHSLINFYFLLNNILIFKHSGFVMKLYC